MLDSEICWSLPVKYAESLLQLYTTPLLGRSHFYILKMSKNNRKQSYRALLPSLAHRMALCILRNNIVISIS